MQLEEAERDRINAQSRTQAHGWSALFSSGIFKAETEPSRWLPFPPKDSKSERMSPRTTAAFKRLMSKGLISNQMVLAAAMSINFELIPKDEEI